MSGSNKLPSHASRSIAILRDAVANGFALTGSPSARALNGKGHLVRDKQDAKKWYPTERGRVALAKLDGHDAQKDVPSSIVSQRTEVATIRADASGLVETIERARSLFTEGDLINARLLAGGAYEQAKAADSYARKVGASQELRDKARRMQGDALLIETRATIGIVDQWDAAQASGAAATAGKRANVSDGNVLTAADIGLTRKEIHEARKLRANEARKPGLIEQAIAVRVLEGLSPTRANLRAAVGTASATQEERGHNLYETPPEAMWTLLALEKFRSTVKEPACGRGAISKMLEEAGYTVLISDLVDYGTADQFGEVQKIGDFLESHADSEEPDIVTNPPYGELLNRFVAHALRVHRPRKMALLLNINFLCGFEDLDREFAMDDNPPSRIIVFKRRLPMMHRDGWDGPKAASRMNTAWFIWEMDEAGIYAGEMRISRVDWKKYVPIPAVESEAA